MLSLIPLLILHIPLSRSPHVVMLIAFALGAALYLLTHCFSINNLFVDFIVKALIIIVLSNLVLVLVFRRTPQFVFIKDFAKAGIQKAKGFIRKS